MRSATLSGRPLAGPAAPRPAALAAILLLLPVLGAGCTGGGGSVSASSVAGGTGGGAGAPSNEATRTHQALARSALGPPGAPLPSPDLTQPGLDAWNDMIARCWPELRRGMIDPMLEGAIRQQLASLPSHTVVQVRGLRNLVVDTSAPIGVRCGPVASGRQTLVFEGPKAPGAWRVSASVDVLAQLTVNVLGVPIGVGASFDVSADVSDVRVEADCVLDLASGARPSLASVGAPRTSLRIALTSSDPMFAQVAGILTQLLDPVLRAALVGGAIYAQQQALPLIRSMGATPFRPPSYPLVGLRPAPDLEAIAEEISDEIQRHHLPWGTLLPAVFDDPVFGRGNVVEYFDHGDSVGWTSTYIMGEVIRHDLTGDPRALAGAKRALQGVRDCADMGGPGQGILGRCVVPVSDPLIRQINGDADYYEQDVRGIRMGTLGDMSRDHHLESLMGLMQAWLRVPDLRAKAGSVVTDLNDAIQRLELVGYKTPGSSALSRATPWAQSPGGVWGFVRASYVIDPGRYAALHARYEAVTPVIWLAFWGSALDVHYQYYKHNLGANEIVALATMETDPARYRDTVKMAAIHHDGVKDHHNAWFDTVFGMVVPAAAPQLGQGIRDALERWTLRPRRMFVTDLPNDPTIPKTAYVNPETRQAETVAAEPIPIEKRVPNDYLWQRSPFELTGWYRGPHHQYPGVDLTQPYWTARAYGLVR